MKKKYKPVMFVIHPTDYRDYDILAIGERSVLYILARKYRHFHLIKKSKLGYPILILDTCDTLKDAKNCIKRYKELYEEEKITLQTT